MLHRLARVVLALVPVTTCAARLHAHAIEPVDTTQELTRCARMVRIVVSRRGAHSPAHAAGQTSSAASDR